ncbi:hypothetical protein FQN57_000385 [Myotisia sp. PD_48]|nr:hypothetical protein FQN57_000385 [Myotisia sp. PD_48]
MAPNIESQGLPSHGDWRDQLFRDGYTIVKGVISPERAQTYVDRMLAWLESFPYGFDRQRKSTWTAKHLPPNLKGGMYQGFAVQHEQFMWDARQEPNVISAFAKLWGTSDLLVSFDAMNLTLPGTSTTKQTAPWPHIDQNPSKPDLECVQGILNLAPNGPKDGGLIVLQGSSILNEEFFKGQQKAWGGLDWYGFKSKDIKWFESRGCKWIKVCAEPGDLILWDSRTIHHNTLPERDALRAAMYLCYTPASFATQADLGRKAAFLSARIGTVRVSLSHSYMEITLIGYIPQSNWPHLAVPIAPSFSNGSFSTDDHKLPYERSRPIEEPEETDLLLQLAGVIPYE